MNQIKSYSDQDRSQALLGAKHVNDDSYPFQNLLRWIDDFIEEVIGPTSKAHRSVQADRMMPDLANTLAVIVRLNTGPYKEWGEECAGASTSVGTLKTAHCVKGQVHFLQVLAGPFLGQ